MTKFDEQPATSTSITVMDTSRRFTKTLTHRLRKAGFAVKQQRPIKVFDEDGTPIGDYFADLLVEDGLIVELKTTRALAPEHHAQILGYLKSARREHGIRNNSGSYNFEVRKFALSERHSRRNSFILSLIFAISAIFAVH